MFQRCIYCSAQLRDNEALETFPVGRSIAFDAARGRLWAVCAGCGRWNLAPIEERWEPVEEAEARFREARLRVQSENIGLARLPDGTRLIRVGDALPGELAAWRYGEQLALRRRRYLIVAGAALTGGLLVAGALAWATATAGALSLVGNSRVMVDHVRQRRVFHAVPAELAGGTRPLPLRRWHLNMARLVPGDAAGMVLEIPNARFRDPPLAAIGRYRDDPDPLRMADADARAVLSRGSVHLNPQGASRRRLREALDLLTAAGGAEPYLHGLAAEPRRLRGQRRGKEPVLTPTQLLAMEMALHEEQERRALAGELAVLTAAWREAEEIAVIADGLATGTIAPGERHA